MLLLAGLTVLSCSKDPDVVIHDKIDFDQCLTPVGVDFDVEYIQITVDCDKIFPDAEKMELEVFSEPFPPDGEANEEYLIRRDFIEPKDFPYTFTGPDETTCYMRLRATNETAGKKPSRWVSGYVKTDVDPDLTCGKPADAKTIVNFSQVTFSWTPAANVKQYEIEIYKEPLPAIGEPDPSNLVRSLVKLASEIPFIEEFGVRKYYYRVRGTNEEDGLKASGWVKGSFTTTAYDWPTDRDAFDYGRSHSSPRTSTITVEAFSALNWNAGDEVPAGSEITVDGITYGPGVKFEADGDRISFAQCNSWDKNYTNNFPLVRYVCFKVNKPGSLSFIPRLGGSTKPEIIVGVKTKKTGQVIFKYVYREKPADSTTLKEKDEANRITVPITREDILGIDEAATIYVCCTTTRLHMYPITWTPD